MIRKCNYSEVPHDFDDTNGFRHIKVHYVNNTVNPKVNLNDDIMLCLLHARAISKGAKQLVFREGSYPFEHRYCSKCGKKYIKEQERELRKLAPTMKKCLRELR